MSYLALARKWRPTKFNEVVGQSHVLTALENALAQNRLHHAYLFSGTRGVGKTTIGRLFAKGLNCETGITSTPCGVCDTCREIDQGRFVDLLEIDAASRTKVEDTRELLDNVQYKPARGRFKVYLIDEVHMLSRHSFNALLKTLEEPPEYVKFLLATTDPQKLPVTILSRCLQFHLKPIGVDAIQQQLQYILEQEAVSADGKALAMLAHAADGSMRDALSLTDQAIALGNGQVVKDTVSHMLGTLDTDQAIYLLEAISTKQPASVIQCIEGLAQNGVEWDGLLEQLAMQLHRIAMCQALPATLDKSQPDSERIALLANAISPQNVQLYYQIALKGREDLPFAPTERVGLEMCLLRMLAFAPVQANVANTISTQASVAPATPQPSSMPQPSAQPSAVASAPVAPQPQVSAAPTTQAPMTQTSSVSEPVEQHMQTYESIPMDAYEEQDSMLGAVEEHEPQARQSAAQPAPAPRTGAAGLRHQLRSQRQGLQTKPGADPKKPKAASAKPESVLERVAKKHGRAERMSPQPMDQATATLSDANEPYQWKPSQPQAAVEKRKELTPTMLKSALEHEKTPEMTQKLIDESIELNDWAALIHKLSIPKLVEQLALNSSYTKNGSSIVLNLRANQAHLNTERAQSELLSALNLELGEECHLSVEISEQGETPLELRDKLYQAKLEQAFDSLEQDRIVQFIEQRFAAELDRNSVRPV
ncbi:DNA polymerase-3 subunit gamma/tau [Vibrio xiamenensis]|uniref:DNA polymerase III subunit gamma/tau n=1 Tax=Vibrio xiamenensis TaxID=861298 RepID=A0A1G8EKX6_9VIBR|nr:DNA polymerase III subunit gamma/tau [Vibrio xiamenensis]SDH70442.1 DNA polymerase-3 subunit gamma/tau [Vibrio xiamenensis]